MLNKQQLCQQTSVLSINLEMSKDIMTLSGTKKTREQQSTCKVLPPICHSKPITNIDHFVYKHKLVLSFWQNLFIFYLKHGSQKCFLFFFFGSRHFKAGFKNVTPCNFSHDCSMYFYSLYKSAKTISAYTHSP